METISTQQAAEMIHSSGGKIFYGEFTKRSTGELRRIVARTGVTSYLKGGERAYNPEEKGLIIVFDLAKCAYRTISIEGLKRLSVNGLRFEVKP